MSRVRILCSVGEKGKNQRSDVIAIQKAINCVIKYNMLPPLVPLREDGVAGKITNAAIRRFQQKTLHSFTPDGRVDPGGKTLEKLNSLLSSSESRSSSVNKIDFIALSKIPLPALHHESLSERFDFHLKKSNPDNIDFGKLTKEEFVRRVFEAAKQEALSSGVPAAVTAAQAILETGYGKHVPIDIHTKRYSYNLFGIKGIGTAGSVDIYTHEVVNGKRVKIVDKFQAYNSFSESIKGRTRFLKQNMRYKFLFNTKDPKEWAEGLQKAGYATDPNYGKTLISIMNSWKLI